MAKGLLNMPPEKQMEIYHHMTSGMTRTKLDKLTPEQYGKWESAYVALCLGPDTSASYISMREKQRALDKIANDTTRIQAEREKAEKESDALRFAWNNAEWEKNPLPKDFQDQQKAMGEGWKNRLLPQPSDSKETLAQKDAKMTELAQLIVDFEKTPVSDREARRIKLTEFYKKTAEYSGIYSNEFAAEPLPQAPTAGGMTEKRKITMPEALLDIETGEFDYKSMADFFHENGHVWRHILLIDAEQNPDVIPDKEALRLKQEHPDFKVNEQAYNMLLQNSRFRASASLTDDLYRLNADERHAIGFETIGGNFSDALKEKVKVLRSGRQARSDKK